MLVDGVIVPVPLLMINPAGAEYVPPVYAPVPVKVAEAVATDLQNGVPA